MKGKILSFDAADKSGMISGEDGNRYKFEPGQWRSAVQIRSGGSVDFAISDGNAVDVYADGGALSSGSKKIPAAILALLLGGFGGHKFYLGYTKQAVIMLLVFIFGFILLGIPSMIIGIIAFIEFIIYLTKSDEDFENTYVIGKKAWF